MKKFVVPASTKRPASSNKARGRSVGQNWSDKTAGSNISGRWFLTAAANQTSICRNTSRYQASRKG